MHLMALGFFVIIPTSKVEQTVDDVEGNLAFVGFLMLCGLTLCGIQADDDFSVRKCNDIGGRGVIKELAMHTGDGFVRDERDFDFLE